MLISVHLGPLLGARKPYSPESIQVSDPRGYCVTTAGASIATAVYLVPLPFSFLTSGNSFVATTVALAKQCGYVMLGSRGDNCQSEGEWSPQPSWETWG